MNVSGKTVLITGANRGIGLAISEAFAKEGASLVLCMREEDGSLVNRMKRLGAKSAVIKEVDLSKFENIDKFGKDIEKLNIDILVNNAGVLTGGLLEEQDTGDIYKMVQINLLAYIHLTKLILPGMIKRGAGKIVNNASISAILNLPSASTYSAAKAGVAAFTRSLDQELAGTGVSTLLLITPGVETRMYEEVRKTYSEHMKVSRAGTITADVWAKKVVDGVKRDKKELWPSGGTWLVGRMYQIFPGIVKFGVARLFKR